MTAPRHRNSIVGTSRQVHLICECGWHDPTNTPTTLGQLVDAWQGHIDQALGPHPETSGAKMSPDEMSGTKNVWGKNVCGEMSGDKVSGEDV